MYNPYLPRYGQGAPQMAVDGGGFLYQPSGATNPGFSGFGADQWYPTSDRVRPQNLGPTGPIAGMPAYGGGQNVAPNYPPSSIPPATQPPMHVPGITGNDMFYSGGKGMGGDRMPTPPSSPVSMAAPAWHPQTSYGTIPGLGGPSAPAGRPPMLPNNTAPNYQNPSTRNEAGWWHQPNGYIQGNGTVSSFDEPGWWNDPSGKPTAGVGGNLAGVGGFGGGGSNPFLDAYNAANAANEARYRDILGGYEAQRNRTGELLNGLTNQVRNDTNRTYDNLNSQVMQQMIGSGLANSTQLYNQQGGVAEKRSAALNRVNDDLMNQRLQAEMQPWNNELAFMERRNDLLPDLNRYADAMQAAGQGGLGGGVNIDLSGMGNGGYMDWGAMPFGGGYGGGFLGYGPGIGAGNGMGQFGRGGGSTIPSSRVASNRADQIMHDLFTGQHKTSPYSPMVFGPGGGGDVPFNVSIDPLTSGASPTGGGSPDLSFKPDAFFSGQMYGSNPGMWRNQGAYPPTLNLDTAGPPQWGNIDNPNIGTIHTNQLGENYVYTSGGWRKMPPSPFMSRG